MNELLQIIPPYSRSASFYDELMEDIDYEGWAGYLLDLATELHINTDRIIDFSCGTGTLLNYLSKNSISVRGQDLSAEMIRQARVKYPDHEWFVQDMLTASMPPEFTLGINIHDSLNYITQTAILKNYIQRMQKGRIKGQCIILDFALPELIRRYFVNQTETKKMTNGDTLHRWHAFDDKKNICRTYLEITHDMQTVTEIHIQYIWTFEEIKNLFLVLPGENLLFLEEFSYNSANKESERLLIVIYDD